MKYKGIAKLKLTVSIFTHRTKIQNDQNILDTCSTKTELISPKRSEKYFTQAEAVNGTSPDSRITADKKQNIWGLSCIWSWTGVFYAM